MKNVKIAETSDKKIKQITLPDERYYEVNGKYLPSVTWILESYPKSVGFYQWLASKGWDTAQAIKEAAGDRGSKVHNAIQDLLTGKEIKYQDLYWNDTKSISEPLTLEEWECLISFQNFWEDYKPILISSEKVCHSQRYNFAGTSDCIAVIDKKIVLIDFKTSSKIYPSHWLQIAAYAWAEREMKGYKVNQTAVLRLGSNHKRGYEFKIFDLKETWDNFKYFLGVRKVFELENKDKSPDFTLIPNSIALKIIKLSDVKKRKIK